MQQIRQKATDQTSIKDQFSQCICRYFTFLLDNLTRVELKNQGYHTTGSVNITVIQNRNIGELEAKNALQATE